MLAIAILLLAQVAVLVWALVRRRGMRPILVANLLFAAAVLIFVVPQLPEELRYIRAGGDRTVRLQEHDPDGGRADHARRLGARVVRLFRWQDRCLDRICREFRAEPYGDAVRPDVQVQMLRLFVSGSKTP